MKTMQEKIYRLVQDKVGKKIDADIEESINNRKAIDVAEYVSKLLEDEFNNFELDKLEDKLQTHRDSSLDFFNVEKDEDLLADEAFDVSSLNLEATAPTSDSGAALKELLQNLEYLTPEEIISQPSWPEARQALLTILIFGKDLKVSSIVLKTLKRLLAYNSSSKVVSEAFAVLTEATSGQIEEINKRTSTVESEELYEIQENKVYRRSSERKNIESPLKKGQLLTVVRSMFLLVATHRSMPAAWLRFNERRLTEIISAFVHMLALSASENRMLSALDLLSVVDPKAAWSRHWCHTSLGRSLLAQSLRRNRRLLNVIVDTVVCTGGRSPQEPLNSLIGVATSRLQKARLCQCLTLLAYVVQSRAGRALFPLTTTTRRRPWTARDVVFLIMGLVNEKHGDESVCYRLHLAEIGRMLSSVEEDLVTARGTQFRSRRVNR